MKNPEKYGLIGHRKASSMKKVGSAFFVLICILASLAFFALPIYVVTHFVLKAW